MKRLLQTIFVVIATLVILILAWQLRGALILFVLSLAVAAAARGPVNFWMKRKLSRGLGILLTYLLGLIFLGGLIYLISSPVLRDLQLVTDSFDRFYWQITTNWPAGTQFQQMISNQLPPPQDLYDAITGEQGEQLVQNFFGVASGILGSLAKFGVVLVLSIYWSIDRLHFERQWVSLLPVDMRSRAREVWRDVEDSVGGYIRSELFQSVVAGLLLGAGYFIMGLDFPALIALTGALLWLIPWLGAGLALVLPLLVGLSTGPGLAIAAPVYTVVVLAFLEHVVEPRLFNRRRYSSLLIVIVLVAMGMAYGLIGLLLAPPLVAAIQTLYNSLARATPSVIQEGLAIKVNSLRQRVASMEEQVTGMEEKPSPEVVNLLSRLSHVMEQADEFFKKGEGSQY